MDAEHVWLRSLRRTVLKLWQNESKPQEERQPTSTCTDITEADKVVSCSNVVFCTPHPHQCARLFRMRSAQDEPCAITLRYPRKFDFSSPFSSGRKKQSTKATTITGMVHGDDDAAEALLPHLHSAGVGDEDDTHPTVLLTTPTPDSGRNDK